VKGDSGHPAASLTTQPGGHGQRARDGAHTYELKAHSVGLPAVGSRMCAKSRDGSIMSFSTPGKKALRRPLRRQHPSTPRESSC